MRREDCAGKARIEDRQDMFRVGQSNQTAEIPHMQRFDLKCGVGRRWRIRRDKEPFAVYRMPVASKPKE